MAELITDLEKHPLVADGGPLKLGIRTNTGGDTLPHMRIRCRIERARADAAAGDGPPGPLSSTLVQPRRADGSTPRLGHTGRMQTPPPPSADWSAGGSAGAGARRQRRRHGPRRAAPRPMIVFALAWSRPAWPGGSAIRCAPG
jgi:hypothetical protein